jgi:hypothetical protein
VRLVASVMSPLVSPLVSRFPFQKQTTPLGIDWSHTAISDTMLVTCPERFERVHVWMCRIAGSPFRTTGIAAVDTAVSADATLPTFLTFSTRGRK